jgi:hypothetical protein
MPNKTAGTAENPNALGDRTPDMGQVCKIHRAHEWIQTIRHMTDEASTRTEDSKDFTKPSLTFRNGEMLEDVETSNKIMGGIRLLSQIRESITLNNTIRTMPESSRDLRGALLNSYYLSTPQSSQCMHEFTLSGP